MKLLSLILLTFGLTRLSQAQATSVDVSDYSIRLDESYSAPAQLLRPGARQDEIDLVILFHGSGPYDMDATVPNRDGSIRSANFRMIAEYLASKGGASLRYHKRGVLGIGKFDRAEMQKAMALSQLVTDAEEVLEFALELPSIGSIYLFGWSEGAWVAAHLAARRPSDVAGVILQAPPNSPMARILERQHIEIGLSYLADVIDVDKNGVLTLPEVLSIPSGPVQLMPTFYLWGPSSSPDAPSFSARVDVDGNAEIDIEKELRPVVVGRLKMMEMIPQTLSPVISDVMRDNELPIFILHGDMDGWVSSAEGMSIKEALPDRVELHRYAELGHALSTTSVMAEDGFDDMDIQPLHDLATWLDLQKELAAL